MKYTPLTLIALLLILLAQPQAAQADGGDDFGIWSTVGVEKKIDKRWRIGGEAEWRTMDDASKTDRWSFGVYGQYKVSSWLKASAGYDLLVDNNLVHRINPSLIASDEQLRFIYDKAIDDVALDLMPFIEANYPVKTGRENTAVAGLSEGGAKSLCTGFKWLDKFGYIAGFAP